MDKVQLKYLARRVKVAVPPGICKVARPSHDWRRGPCPAAFSNLEELWVASPASMIQASLARDQFNTRNPAINQNPRGVVHSHPSPR